MYLKQQQQQQKIGKKLVQNKSIKFPKVDEIKIGVKFSLYFDKSYFKMIYYFISVGVRF